MYLVQIVHINKIVIAISLLFFCNNQLHCQEYTDKLYNVPWLPIGYKFGENTIRLPQREAGIFIFRTDSTYLYQNPETGINETMKYSLQGDLIEMETYFRKDAVIYRILILDDERLIVKPYEKDEEGNLIESNMSRLIFKRLDKESEIEF